MEATSSEYRMYGIRWVQMMIYILGTFANSMSGMTFAPIESETSTFFSITTTQVNALAIVFLFLYTVGTAISIWLSKTLTLRQMIITGSLLNLGVIIRLVALVKPNAGYASLLIGQLFPAIAAPFFLNTTAVFAARWFAPSQRDIATAVCSMANPLG